MASKTYVKPTRSWSDRLGSRGKDSKEEQKSNQLVLQAVATLQLVGADETVMEQVASEILDRGLTDDSSGGTADTLIGGAVIETITGKPVPAFLPRAGEVAKALIDAQANLQLAGIDDTDEARKLTDRIVKEGLRGERAKDAVREVVGPVVKQAEAAQQGGGEGETQTTPPPEQRPGADLGERVPPEHWGGNGDGPSESAAPAEAQAAESEEAPAEQPAREASGAIDFNDIDFEPEAPTDSSLVPIEPPDTFYGPDGAAEPGTPPSTDDDILSPPPDNQGSGTQGSSTHDGSGNDGGNTGDGNGDDDDNGDNGDATASSDDDSGNQGGDDGTAPDDSSEDQPAASSTPNPERENGGSGFGLQEATDGRLGGDAAHRQQDRLDLLDQGGGAAGPETGEDQASGVLLTPEERANAERLLGVKAGGGITTPSPLEEGGAAITERDLKELVLRGNGGAGTPEVTVFPVLQPPQSPLAPPAGVPGVGGDPITGLRAAGSVQALPAFQGFGALQRSAALPAETAPQAGSTTSATAPPLGAASAELGLVAPNLFSSQAGGLVGAEIRFASFAAFQGAALLA